MKKTLPVTIASANDVRGVMAELADMQRQLRQHGIKRALSAKTRQAPGIECSDTTAQLLHEWGLTISALTLEDLQSAHHALEEYLRHAPTISVTLAAPAPKHVRDVIVAWCRKELAADVLITIDHHQAILGGLVVRTNSRIYDWSLRRGLMAHRTEFSKVLMHV